MTRQRIRKPKPRRRAAHGEPLENTLTRHSQGMRLIKSIEELMEDMDQALDETGGWPG